MSRSDSFTVSFPSRDVALSPHQPQLSEASRRDPDVDESVRWLPTPSPIIATSHLPRTTALLPLSISNPGLAPAPSNSPITIDAPPSTTDQSAPSAQSAATTTNGPSAESRPINVSPYGEAATFYDYCSSVTWQPLDIPSTTGSL